MAADHLVGAVTRPRRGGGGGTHPPQRGLYERPPGATGEANGIAVW